MGTVWVVVGAACVNVPTIGVVVMVIVDVTVVVERVYAVVTVVQAAAVGIGGESDAEMEAAGGEIGAGEVDGVAVVAQGCPDEGIVVVDGGDVGG
jgi:hypothetical protein